MVHSKRLDRQPHEVHSNRKQILKKLREMEARVDQEKEMVHRTQREVELLRANVLDATLSDSQKAKKAALSRESVPNYGLQSTDVTQVVVDQRNCSLNRGYIDPEAEIGDYYPRIKSKQTRQFEIAKLGVCGASTHNMNKVFARKKSHVTMMEEEIRWSMRNRYPKKSDTRDD